MWMQLLAVGCGGFIGAISRYGITLGLAQLSGDRFPWGTLVVNLIGCAFIGALMQLAILREDFSPALKLFLVTGILGSLTTFSTFSYETIGLFERGDFKAALLYLGLNLVLGLLAVFAGRAALLKFI